MKDRILILTLLAVLAAGVGGCRVDKSNNGDNVKIATPFGAIAVNKDQPTAAEIGLPAYPGSVLDTGDDGNQVSQSGPRVRRLEAAGEGGPLQHG